MCSGPDVPPAPGRVTNACTPSRRRPELAPSCAEAGVLGVVPGIVGLLQATEALKLLLGIGEPLVGRLLVFDALRASFEELDIPRDPDCATCGRISPLTE